MQATVFQLARSIERFCFGLTFTVGAYEAVLSPLGIFGNRFSGYSMLYSSVGLCALGLVGLALDFTQRRWASAAAVVLLLIVIAIQVRTGYAASAVSRDGITFRVLLAIFWVVCMIYFFAAVIRAYEIAVKLR